MRRVAVFLRCFSYGKQAAGNIDCGVGRRLDGSYAFLYAGRNNGVYLRQAEEAEAERMSDREKYVVANWVADGHNSRVPEEIGFRLAAVQEVQTRMRQAEGVLLLRCCKGSVSAEA